MIEVLFALVLNHTIVRDNGQYNSVDQSIRDWFKGLHNDRGGACCDWVDGRRVDDFDWECKNDEQCAVKIEGDWITVPEHAMLKATNRVGYAVVWVTREQGKPTIVCFLKGTLS